MVGTIVPIRCGLVVRMLASQLGRMRERPGFDSPQRKIFLAFSMDPILAIFEGFGLDSHADPCFWGLRTVEEPSLGDAVDFWNVLQCSCAVTQQVIWFLLHFR